MFSTTTADYEQEEEEKKEIEIKLPKEYETLKAKDIPKYEEIKEILLAAGYFRVRISTLSPFDRVVGGLCWCLRNSNVDVDVDVIYEEDPNIGQKIKISESIITSLKRMQCPYKVQPVQIQGLDFTTIFKVLQWLVKKVFETREENKEIIKNYSLLIFDENFQEKLTPEQRLKDDTFHKPEVLNFQEKLNEIYSFPSRKFKKENLKIRDTHRYVQSVLLEYGKEFKLIPAKDEEEEEEGDFMQEMSKRMSVRSREEKKQQIKKENELKKKENLKEINKMKENMKELDAEKVLSNSQLNKFVSLGSNDIMEQKSAYDEKTNKLKEEIKNQKKESVRHQNIINQLKKEAVIRKEEFLKEKENYEEVKKKYIDLKGTQKGLVEYNQKVMDRIKSLGNETNLKDDGLVEIKRLILLNESLKKQENEFRNTCKTQLIELKNMISKLEANTNTQKLKQFEKLNEAFEKDQEKMKKIKVLDSRKNREIALIRRKIDEIPIRTELSQYEKRFTELYEQIVLKLDETKKYFDIYNTLKESLEYKSKQLSLFTSIRDTLTKAYQSKQLSNEYKKWLLQTMEKSLESVTKSKEIVEKRLIETRKKKTEKSEAHAKLIQQQREYFNAVKDFQTQCKYNEVLLKKLKELKGK